MTPFRLLTFPMLIAMHPSLLTATNIVLALTQNLDADAMHNNTTKTAKVHIGIACDNDNEELMLLVCR